MSVVQDVYAMSQEENMFCAKRILVDSVYKQANLEGIGVTYAQTEDILNNVNVSSLKPVEINKVCCLRDAWNFLLSDINAEIHLGYLQELHEIVARFNVDYRYLGKWCTEDVLISGTSWRPALPNVDRMHTELQDLLKNSNGTDKAIKVGLWLMRLQPFKDGNKRVGSFIMNKILIAEGRGVFNVPVELDGTFKQMLVDYYVLNEVEPLAVWIVENCLQGTTKVKDMTLFE